MTQEIYDFAKSIALKTGELLKDRWENAELKLTSKGFRDIVTDADFASQKLLTEAILEKYPTHGFLPEEDDGSLPTEGDVIWVIDPIDGTSNFSRKSPLFSVSIGVAHPPSDNGEIEIFAGVVLDPIRGEMFHAQKGGGAWINDRPIAVSTIADLDNSIGALDWPRDPAERQQILNVLNVVAHQARSVRSIGTAALALCYVACGRIDGYFHLNLQPWDVAAASLILQEAGGRFSDFSGAEWRLGERSALGTNGHLHTAYSTLIQNELGK